MPRLPAIGTDSRKRPHYARFHPLPYRNRAAAALPPKQICAQIAKVVKKISIAAKIVRKRATLAQTSLANEMDRIPQQTPKFSSDSSPPVAADRQIVGVDSLSAKVSCTSDAQAISAMNARGQPPDTDAFICMLTDHQIDLQSFIMSSLGNYSDTLDVLQMTNIALWKKAATFRSGAPFLPWALKVAKFEILAFMRTRRRDRHTFSPELVELMLDVAVERSPQMSDRSLALRDCIKELSERNREFLRIRYSQNQSIHEVAEKTGRSVDSVKSLYLRIRRALERCIDRKLAAEAR